MFVGSRNIPVRPSCIFVLLSQLAFTAGAAVDFDREVQPILAGKCFACHGPDEAKRKGGLRLDDAAGLYAELGEGRVAVKGGDREHSALWTRITTGDAEERMPPAGAKQLTEEEIATLGKWIDEGGKWEEHWSLRPLAKPEVPEASGGWARNEIDGFVFAKLAEKGMRPALEADRRTLIRRLSFDLWGLPPTPEDIDAFINDPDPEAYERLVERMLESPRYGERWGRHWLDVAHYGETHGYDKDKRRPNAWPYRDYVIDAFNRDKPYGEFVREQIAGDVMTQAPEGVVATGFLAAGPWDYVGHVELREGSTDKDITRVLDRDDMVSSVMGTFASATVHCARCHDHKFDPISQADYYALQAVFAGVDRANREYDADPVVHRKRQEWRGERAGLVMQRDALAARMDAQKSPERETLEAKIAGTKVALEGLRTSPSNGYHSGIEQEQEVTKWVQVDLGEALPLEKVRLVPAMPTDFPDTPGFGFPVRYRVALASAADFSDAVSIEDKTGADVPNMAGQVVELDAAGKSARYVRVTATKLWPRSGDFVFALAELEALSGGANVARDKAVTAQDSIESGRWGVKNLVDGFDSRRVRGVNASAEQATKLEQELKDLEAARDAAVLAALGAEFVAGKEANDRALEDVEARLKALPAAAHVYAAAHDFNAEGSFTPAKTPRPVHVLARGDVKQPKELARPGALSCVKEMPARFELREDADEGVRRAALAHWLTDVRNPLTWRSIVNRVWHYHFGRGLVETPNDFGRMGAAPTHPELLDWLAGYLIDKEESLKALTKLMVCSATYRQACVENDAYAAIDGSNQFLWRGNRQLLDAESIRDAVLAVSGKLDVAMGGPGYDLFGFEDDHSPRYKYEEHDPSDAKSFRRSVYRFIVRSVPDPLFDTLDCADPSQSVPVRNTTITALQALALLNDKFVLKQSEYLAERVAAAGGDAGTQVSQALRLALGREARPDEATELAAYAEKHGMPAACRVILNMNEFSFVD